MYRNHANTLALCALIASSSSHAVAGGNGIALAFHVTGAGEVEVIREADGGIDTAMFAFNVTMSGNGARLTADGRYTDPSNDVAIEFVTMDQAGTDYLGRTGFGGVARHNGADGFRYLVWVRDNGQPGAGTDMFDVHLFENALGDSVQVYSSNGCGVWEESCADTGVLTKGDVTIHQHR